MLVEHGRYSSVDMAMAVLMERIQSLPDDDRNDLFDLLPGLLSCEDEERTSAAKAVVEILGQTKLTLRPVNIETRSGVELKKWLSFIGGRIRQVRRRADMTQQQLALKSGLPQSHISRLENGEHSPSFATLEKIAKAVGISVSELDPSA